MFGSKIRFFSLARMLMKTSARLVRIVRFVFFFALVLALAAYPMMGESDAHKEGGEAHRELDELMQKMGEALEVLVRDVLVSSLEEEIISDTPFARIEKHAASIAATAQDLPGTERIREDASLIALSHQTEDAAMSLAKAAKGKKLEATVKSLVALHAACINCHKEMRP